MGQKYATETKQEHNHNKNNPQNTRALECLWEGSGWYSYILQWHPEKTLKWK